MPTLFDPVTLGALQLPNRIIMAPLTRSRATAETRPLLLVLNKVCQRADINKSRQTANIPLSYSLCSLGCQTWDPW